MQTLLRDLDCGARRLLQQPRRKLMAVILLIVLGGLIANHSSTALMITPQNQQADKPVEQVHKNIQVLKGLPASQLVPVMHQKGG